MANSLNGWKKSGYDDDYLRNFTVSDAYNAGMTYFYLYQDYDITAEATLFMIAFSAKKSGNLADYKQFYKKLKSLYPKSELLNQIQEP